MKNTICALSILAFSLVINQQPAIQAQPTTLEPALSAALAEAREDEAIRVIVRLADAEHSALIESQLREPLARRIAQRTAFVRALRHAAESAQRDLLAYLDQPRIAQQVSDVRPLWAINAVALAARRRSCRRWPADPTCAAWRSTAGRNGYTEFPLRWLPAC